MLFSVSLLHAVTLQSLSMDDMAQKSTSIIYGRVLDSYGAVQGSLIYTHYHVQVLDTWKGSSTVTEIMLPGGVANGLRQTFAGVPSLTIGANYLMFLWAGPVGSPQLVGLTQGLLNVAPDSHGNLMASRPMTTEQLLDANGKAVQDQPVSLQLSALKSNVISSLNARKVRK
jgi:hypothetical protein